MNKKTYYLMFCSDCGVPKIIPPFIIRNYFHAGTVGVYCDNCGHKNIIPDYIKKIKNEL